MKERTVTVSMKVKKGRCDGMLVPIITHESETLM